jgi:rod shape-determining protein MreD
LTLLLGLMLTLMPLPRVIEPARPYWLALFVIYWNLEGGRLRHLGQAFLIGLVLDVCTASLLGQHALSLVILIFLLERFRARIRFFPPWQQAVAILALLINDRVIQIWIIGLMGNDWPVWSWWLAPVVGVLIWPWLFLMMDALRQAGRVQRQ